MVLIERTFSIHQKSQSEWLYTISLGEITMSLSMSATQFDVAKETIRTFAETKPDASAVVTKDLEIVEQWGVLRKIFCCCMRERYLHKLVPTKSVERFKARLKVLLSSKEFKSNAALADVCERACATFNRLIKETNKELPRNRQSPDEKELCINLEEEKLIVASLSRKASHHSKAEPPKSRQEAARFRLDASSGLSLSQRSHHRTKPMQPSTEETLIEDYDTLIGDTIASPSQPVQINQVIAHSSDQFLRKPLGGHEGPEFRDNSSPSSRASSGSDAAKADESSPEISVSAPSTTICGQVLPSGKPLFVLPALQLQTKPQALVEMPEVAPQTLAGREQEEDHQQRRQSAPFTMALRELPSRCEAAPEQTLSSDVKKKH
jgi:hypothetical protein